MFWARPRPRELFFVIHTLRTRNNTQYRINTALEGDMTSEVIDYDSGERKKEADKEIRVEVES